MEMQTCYLCWKTRCHQLMLARSRYSNRFWMPTPWRQRTENSNMSNISPFIIPPLLYFCLVLFSCRLKPRVVNVQQSLPAAYGFLKLCNPTAPFPDASFPHRPLSKGLRLRTLRGCQRSSWTRPGSKRNFKSMAIWRNWKTGPKSSPCLLQNR